MTRTDQRSTYTDEDPFSTITAYSDGYFVPSVGEILDKKREKRAQEAIDAADGDQSAWFCRVCSGGSIDDVAPSDAVWHTRTLGVYGPGERVCPATGEVISAPPRYTGGEIEDEDD